MRRLYRWFVIARGVCVGWFLRRTRHAVSLHVFGAPRNPASLRDGARSASTPYPAKAVPNALGTGIAEDATVHDEVYGRIAVHQHGVAGILGADIHFEIER